MKLLEVIEIRGGQRGRIELSQGDLTDLRRWHVFQLLAGPLADANRALATVGKFVGAHTAVGIAAR